MNAKREKVRAIRFKDACRIAGCDTHILRCTTGTSFAFENAGPMAGVIDGCFNQDCAILRPSYLHVPGIRYNAEARRDGREAEGGGLLNRYRAKSSIEGSNPSLSASEFKSL
jgi:hypothetical protein